MGEFHVCGSILTLLKDPYVVSFFDLLRGCSYDWEKERITHQKIAFCVCGSIFVGLKDLCVTLLLSLFSMCLFIHLFLFFRNSVLCL